MEKHLKKKRNRSQGKRPRGNSKSKGSGEGLSLECSRKCKEVRWQEGSKGGESDRR